MRARRVATGPNTMIAAALVMLAGAAVGVYAFQPEPNDAARPTAAPPVVGLIPLEVQDRTAIARRFVGRAERRRRPRCSPSSGRDGSSR